MSLYNAVIAEPLGMARLQGLATRYNMSTVEKRPIEIRDSNNSGVAGTLNVTLFAPNDRTVRALKTLGLFWALAVGSIPIIIAHWVLVPGFLIAGPIMAVRRYRMTESVDGAEGTCPACKGAIKVSMETTDTLPKWTYCPACNAPIQLVPSEKPSS